MKEYCLTCRWKRKTETGTTAVNEGFGMKKIWKRLICLALLLALCLGLGLAFSEETGKVTLTIGSADSKFDRKGIKVELYRISTNVIGRAHV